MSHLTRREWFRLSGALGLALAPFTLRAAGEDVQARAMIEIPSGPFLMGTPEREARRLAHRHRCHVSWLAGETPSRVVRLAGFRMDKYPVTNRQYHAFCQATGHAPPVHWDGPIPSPALHDVPVTHVHQADARTYARWAGKRLPTEAEWEKAARGPDGLLYPWGHEFNAVACHWDYDGPVRAVGPVPVDRHPLGASPYGVMDMCGNAAEWCEDGPGPGNAFIKGGSWLATSPLDLRPAARGMSGNAGNRLSYIGFRCVQDL